MNKLRVLIADDEPLIRRGIRDGLQGLDGLEIAGECGNGLEAVQMILTAAPDLVLLDVQMPKCSGIEVVRQVGPERMPLVIFVTAYDEYALKAFELNAVDYLLKPFDEIRLHHAIERARQRLAVKNQATIASQLQKLLDASAQGWQERFVIRNGDRYEFVTVDAVDWAESANNYVQLHCGTKTHLMSETLNGLEKKLNPQKFARIHRGKIVNVSRIVAIHSLINGVYEMEIHNGVRLTTGRQFRNAVQNLIRK